MNLDASNPTNIELLRLARDIAYADYNNRKANLHNQWIIDNELMLKTRGITAPYPAIPQYPTEDEIITKAQRFIDFINRPRPDLEKEKLHNEVKVLITDVQQELGRTPVVEQQIEPTQNTIPEEKTSVMSKIKNALR